MANNWIYRILLSAFNETDFLIFSTCLTISSIAALFITLIFCVKRRSPASSSKAKNKSQMSAPSPNTPGMPNLKQQDAKSPALKVTGNGKPTNNNNNVKAGTPGQSLRAGAEGGGGTMEENVGGGETKGNNNNNNQGGEQKIDIKDGSKKPSGGKGGGGAAAVAIGGGGIPVTTAKDSGRHQEKHRDVDDTQRSHQSTKKKKKASAEHPKEKKSKSDKLKNGVALFAPEMDVGSDEETLQNVKSLEKENEHSLQNDAK